MKKQRLKEQCAVPYHASKAIKHAACFACINPFGLWPFKNNI